MNAAKKIALGSLVLTSLPTIALAAPRTFQELANYLVTILNGATSVLIVLGIVVYFWGISTNIMKMKDEGGEKVKAYFFWGVIVLFVMFSIWGILNLLKDTLMIADVATSAPSSQQGSFTPQPFNQ